MLFGILFTVSKGQEYIIRTDVLYSAHNPAVLSDSAAKASILKTETDAISIQLSLYHTHKEAYVSAMGEAHYNNRVAQLIDSLPNVVQNRLNVDDVDLEPL